MTIETVTMNWLDIILGMFVLMVWLEYEGSLVGDVAVFLGRILKEGMK